MESENLIKWKAGQSGNPNGRPKGRVDRRTIARMVGQLLIDPDTLTDGIKTRLKALYPDLPEKVELETLILLIQGAKALSGDTYAADKLLNRIHGLPGQGNDEPLDEDEIDVIDATQERDLDQEQIDLYFKKLEERY